MAEFQGRARDSLGLVGDAPAMGLWVMPRPWPCGFWRVSSDFQGLLGPCERGSWPSEWGPTEGWEQW